MATELIINAALPETRIALMEDGEIQDLVIERPSGKGITGNIYKGRVTRVLPGMQAAFVDIGLEKAAFLYVDDVFVHSEIWQEEEGETEEAGETGVIPPAIQTAEGAAAPEGASETAPAVEAQAPAQEGSLEPAQPLDAPGETIPDLVHHDEDESEDEDEDEDDDDIDHGDDEDEDEDDDRGPIGMGDDPENKGNQGDEDRQGTISPQENREPSEPRGGDEGQAGEQQAGSEAAQGQPAEGGQSAEGGQDGGPRRRGRRGRRGGRFRRGRDRNERNEREGQPAPQQNAQPGELPENYHEQMADVGEAPSDRATLANANVTETAADENRGVEAQQQAVTPVAQERPQGKSRPEFREQRSRDRRIRPKAGTRSVRAQVNIQDLLKEGQEVIVQVAKDPIATKGARLTCHISLPGRHLVCMPTIDHVGVSRRIERDDERRKLREYVERYRPRNLGFIVRTASGRQQSEKRIKQDIEYLTRLWTEIREKAGSVTAPALVYEDLNPVLRAIRDWVTEDIDKVIVDSRYHYNEILRFVSHFMPSLKQKVELYHGDIPIFDAYNISTELSRALERKVWLKSGGYIVVDQAEALVAIDVNTGRYVGKKSLEDTILKTNLEAVQEIAYQLRLRNAGGIIILDLIDMEKEENKQRVYRALEEALRKDRARPTILKISELGLVEMTRKRTRDTMVRALCESCTSCEGKGFIKSKQTVGYEVLREIERVGVERDVAKILVQAHPDVIDILAIDERETLDHLERRHRKQIFLQAVTDFHQEQFEVSSDKKPRAEREEPRGHQRESRGRDRDRGDRNRNRDRDRDRDRDRERDRDRDRERAPGGLPQPRPIVAGAAAPGENARSEAQPQEGGQPQSEGQFEGAPSVEEFSPSPEQQAMAQGSAQDHGFDSEEDRLAFLRAQAAQDAALARMNAGPGVPGSRPNTGGGGANRGPNEGGRNNKRGRRGKRGRFGGRDGGRDRDRGPRMGGGTGIVPRPRDPGAAIVPAPVNNDSGGGNGGGRGDDEGGGAGGGTDHSQPPV